MLNFTREKVRVDVAPGCQSIVIGVGAETQAIALEIVNEGETPLASLKLKYGHSASGQWWDALTKEKDFTQPSTFLRKWDGPNPYSLPKGEKSVLYLDVSEIESLMVEAIAQGNKSTYPEPYTCLTVNAYSIKLSNYGAAAVSTVDPANTSQAMLDGEVVTNQVGYITKGAQSISLFNSGEAALKVYFLQEDGSWKERSYPPGSNFSWSTSTPYERYPELRFDATGTEVSIAVSGATLVVGDSAPAMGSLGAVTPKVAAPESVVKVEWNLSRLPPDASYAIALYPAAATAPTQAVKTAMFTDSYQTLIKPTDKRIGSGNLTLKGVVAGMYKIAVSQVDGTALLLDVRFTVK